MTVSSEVDRSGPYDGNGVTTAFPYKFKIVNEAHIQVISTDALGRDRTLLLAVDYTVSGVGAEGGGSVAISLPPAAGTKVTLLRDVPFTQETDLENQGAYFAEVVEAAFDLLTMEAQQLKERLDRAVTIPPAASPADLDRLIGDILRLGESADEIDAVAGIRTQVVTVATVSGGVSTVAGIAPAVSAVAADLAAINIVAADKANIDTVAADKASIDTVAAIAPDTVTVSAIAPHVTSVAAISSQVQTVAANVQGVKNFGDIYLGAKTAEPVVRNDGTALQQGDLYFNVPTGELLFFDGTAWHSVAQQSLNATANRFAGDGATATFQLSRSPNSVNTIFVWVGGVRQVPLVDYTVAGAVLTLTEAPANGVVIDTLVLSTTATLNTPADGTVTALSISNVATEQSAIRDKIGVADAAAMKWLSKGIGEDYIVDDSVAGVQIPPTNDPRFRYVKLTAGLTVAGGYNNGALSSETVTGSDPTVTATAVVSFPGSPMQASKIRLVNSERRFMRAGLAGAIEDSQNLAHAHGVNDPGHAHAVADPGHVHAMTGSTSDNGDGGPYVTTSPSGVWGSINTAAAATGIGIYGQLTGISLGLAGGNEARPRYYGRSHYMRIA